MKIDITKKYKFEGKDFGDEWRDCYLEFSMPRYKDIEGVMSNVGDEQSTATPETMQKILNVLKELFVGGLVISGGEPTRIKADDLEDMPLSILTDCIKLITGQVDPL